VLAPRRALLWLACRSPRDQGFYAERKIDVKELGRGGSSPVLLQACLVRKAVEAGYSLGDCRQFAPSNQGRAGHYPAGAVLEKKPFCAWSAAPAVAAIKDSRWQRRHRGPPSKAAPPTCCAISSRPAASIPRGGADGGADQFPRIASWRWGNGQVKGALPDRARSNTMAET